MLLYILCTNFLIIEVSIKTTGSMNDKSIQLAQPEIRKSPKEAVSADHSRNEVQSDVFVC